jgi:demethoxyubiquinone hydroxylase (CLK1/Coq7/Cat5 family)
VYLDPTRSNDLSFSASPLDLTYPQREALDSALRVDQAGEIAANWIYKGQMAVLGDDAKLCSLIQVSSTTVLMATEESLYLSRTCGTKRKDILQ